MTRTAQRLLSCRGRSTLPDMDERLKVTAVGALATAVSVAGLPGASGITTAHGLYSYLTGRASAERLRTALDGLIAAVANLKGYDSREAESRFTALLADCSPEVEGLLYDTHRAIFLGRSKEAWPLLLRLTADRIANHEGKSDEFSRRVAWLLERSEDADVVLLREALRVSGESLVEFYAYAALHAVRMTYQWVQAGPRKLAISPYPGQEGTPKPKIIELQVGWRRPHDVVNLLTESRLGYADGTGAVTFELDEGNLDRLVELFRGI